MVASMKPIWITAPVATNFVRSRPHPGTIASLRTVARVAYDEDALYVALRMYDPNPAAILAPFPRRDDETTSDWVFVEIDSRHDHRSGFSFGVNPRGVQVDGSWSDDIVYNSAWNARVAGERAHRFARLDRRISNSVLAALDVT